MARVCEICKKKTATGGSLARRGLPKKKGGVGLRITGHTKRKYLPNLQRVRATIDGRVRRITVCTRCIKAGKIQKPVRAAAS
jgi:large subunit ribosomal protein L28